MYYDPWVAFASNNNDIEDREDNCVYWKEFIDIESHPWFCGHPGRILSVGMLNLIGLE